MKKSFLISFSCSFTLISACGKAPVHRSDSANSLIMRDSLVTKGPRTAFACSQLSRIQNQTGLYLNAATSWKSGSISAEEALVSMNSIKSKIGRLVSEIGEYSEETSQTDKQEADALQRAMRVNNEDCDDFVVHALKSSTEMNEPTFALLQNSCVTPFANEFKARCSEPSPGRCSTLGEDAASRWQQEVEFMEPGQKCLELTQIRGKYLDLLTPADSLAECDSAYNKALRSKAEPFLQSLLEECRSQPTPDINPIPVPHPSKVTYDDKHLSFPCESGICVPFEAHQDIESGSRCPRHILLRPQTLKDVIPGNEYGSHLFSATLIDTKGLIDSPLDAIVSNGGFCQLQFQAKLKEEYSTCYARAMIEHYPLFSASSVLSPGAKQYESGPVEIALAGGMLTVCYTVPLESMANRILLPYESINTGEMYDINNNQIEILFVQVL
jgi:hypothetical protein